MTREDLLEVNLKIMKDVAANIKAHAPNAFVINVANPLDAMVYALYKITGFTKNKVVGMAGVLDTARFKCFVAEALGSRSADVDGAGARRPRRRHGARCSATAPWAACRSPSSSPKDKLDAIVKRTREGGGGAGGAATRRARAYFAPAASAIAMAESYLLDRKRVLPGCRPARGPVRHQAASSSACPVQIGAAAWRRSSSVELDDCGEGRAGEVLPVGEEDGGQVKL